MRHALQLREGRCRRTWSALSFAAAAAADASSGGGVRGYGGLPEGIQIKLLEHEVGVPCALDQGIPVGLLLNRRPSRYLRLLLRAGCDCGAPATVGACSSVFAAASRLPGWGLRG
jgi:hypothetical protein